MSSNTLERQGGRFYEVFAELARRYQFRDREGICRRELSVSQCYSLEAIYIHGAMTMGELAAHLGLDLSTVTRIVDGLVSERLASRINDAADRRVCRVDLTRTGRLRVAQIRGAIIQEHVDVLRKIPPESREAVLQAMTHLLATFTKRHQEPSSRHGALRSARRDVGATTGICI